MMKKSKGGDTRTVLHFHPALAPVKIGILPLSKKLSDGAMKVYEELAKNITVNSTNVVILVNVTEDRMSIEHLTV